MAGGGEVMLVPDRIQDQSLLYLSRPSRLPPLKPILWDMQESKHASERQVQPWAQGRKGVRA